MLSWSFSSRKEHSSSWYITAIVVVLVLVVYGIVEKIYIMSVVSLLFAWVYLLMENNSQPVTQVDFLERGIQVGGSFYEYVSFSRFSIISMANAPTFIRLYPIKKFASLIDIPLTQEVDITEIRECLTSFMEEDMNNNPTNADTLIHAMKL